MINCHPRKRKKFQKFSNFWVSKITVTILIFLLALCHKSSSISNSKYKELKRSFGNQAESISKAFSDVIRNFYIANNLTFDFIIYRETTKHINDIIDGILKELNGEVVINIKNIDQYIDKMEKSLIIFMKTKKNLHEFHSSKLGYSTSFPSQKNLKFLTFIEEIKKVSQLNEIMQYYDITYVKKVDGVKSFDLRYYEFFIITNENVVDLYANLLYSEDHCEDFRVKLLNTFNIQSQTWKKELKIFDHFDNFHGCMVQFVIYLCFAFNVDIDKNYTEKLMDFIDRTYEAVETLEKPKFYGITHEVIQSMAQKLNFTTHYSAYHNAHGKYYNLRRFRKKNKFFTFLDDEVINFGTSTFSFHFSQAFYTEDFVFVISQNDFYNNYEKLTFPFDTTSWILIFFTFALTFTTIFGLHFCPRWFKEIVFGRGVIHPAYNALGIFFGISQLRLPNESFCRAILLIYLWYCLIIRTCWQSMMFEFMTSDMRKPLPESIEDLFRMNYTILLKNNAPYLEIDIFAELVGNYDFYSDLNDSIEILSGEEANKFREYYNQTLTGETKQKYAFLMPIYTYRTYCTIFNTSLPIMKNVKITKSYGYQLPKHHMLFLHLNKIFDKLIPTGIPEHLYKKGYWMHLKPKDNEIVDTRRVLSMSDLEFGFVIILGFLGLSIFVFICEVYAFYMKILLKKLLGLYEFLNDLKEILRNYHDRW
ncbi:hypothetical protein PVAND_009063 [Polypedilum vanderplanki]|uniref:Ionotropic receptor n=1 Tax=Polypedilum vanderplanki TaxID=319348 RepID=A0A9J6CCL9_POLVA|nr:hypothetical protein PVAND_009063 [Polypedilum vanderplanki]